MPDMFDTARPEKREALAKEISLELKRVLGTETSYDGHSTADRVTIKKLYNNNFGVIVAELPSRNDQNTTSKCTVYEVGPSGSIMSMTIGRCDNKDLTFSNGTKTVPEQTEHRTLIEKLKSLER